MQKRQLLHVSHNHWRAIMQNDSNLEMASPESQFINKMAMTNYHCNCGGLILLDFEAYQVGDEVNFMIQKRKSIGNGNISVSQTAHSGKITQIDGDDITVKTQVRTYELSRYEITPKGAPGPIEYFRIGRCRCELDKPEQVS